MKAVTPRQTSLLIATDFTKTSERAVQMGFAAADRMHCVPHLVWVRPKAPMIDPRLAAPPAHDDGSDDQLHIHDYAARQLDAYIQLHGEASFVAAVSHTRSGDPAREIVALAKDLDSALVVVGTAGRTGMKRLLRGSVSEQVVRHSGSSVLVIPSEELAAAARDSVPSIEPPCPVCVAERLSSQGAEMWCSQHRGPSVQRHTSHTVPRNVAARENAPLTFPMD